MSRLVVPFVLFLFGMSAVSAEPRSQIKGQVTDSEGADIAKARVLIHYDPSGSGSVAHTFAPLASSASSIVIHGARHREASIQDIIAFTDTSGMYSIAVSAGFYDVFISAPAFTPVATKLRVNTGQAARLDTKLQIDPLVSKELGHEIYPGRK